MILGTRTSRPHGALSAQMADDRPAQFECGTRILREIHGRDARATNPSSTRQSRVAHVKSSA